ncbi:MAG: hypothetical protein ACFFG0_29050 [Candidatus Thorarchaeota archaeon]
MSAELPLHKFINNLALTALNKISFDGGHPLNISVFDIRSNKFLSGV